MLPNAHDDSIIRAGCLGTRDGVLMSMPRAGSVEMRWCSCEHTNIYGADLLREQLKRLFTYYYYYSETCLPCPLSEVPCQNGNEMVFL